VGLSLAAIHEYGSIKEETLLKLNPERGFTFVRRVITLGSDDGRQFEAIAKTAGEKKGASQDLAGLVTLLAFYIYKFHQKVEKPDSYAKGVMPILAKTNFAEMFKRLNSVEKKKYNKKPKKFVDLVLKAVNSIGFNVEKNSPVIPQGRVEKGNFNWKVGDLTLEDWLAAIPTGTDRLTEQHYEELFGFGNLGGKEGVGGTGEKVDLTPKDKAAMVLEFRAGVGGLQIPVKQWEGFAFDYYHFVRRLHGSEGT
jgi:hypothetical protein